MSSLVSSAGGRCGSATVWPCDIKALRLHPLGLSSCSVRSLVRMLGLGIRLAREGISSGPHINFFALPPVELFLPRGAEGLCRGTVIFRGHSLAANVYLSGLSALVSINK